MNQTTKLSLQKGVGIEKSCKKDEIPGFDLNKLDCLIDLALMDWVTAHPEQTKRYGDAESIREFFRNSKVIYL